MRSAICNYSEIAPAKKVLLHRPGDEFLNLTPNSLDRLLFDDIPFLKVAQQEHDALANALRAEGVEVVYLVDLVAEALEAGGRTVRKKFIEQFIAEGGITSSKPARYCFDYLNKIKDNHELVKKCIAGTDLSELMPLKSIPSFYTTRDIGRMVLDPIPNILFTRDAFSTVGNGVTLHRMWAETRNRESLFLDYIFKYHPFYDDIKQYYGRSEPYSIEGGDIQVLSKEVIAVGISQRTDPVAIANFANNLFKDRQNTFKYVLAIDIPDERSFMHLDTVMTRVDVDKFAVQDAIMDISTIYEITKGAGSGGLDIVEIHQGLQKVLEKYLHINRVHLIKCGNGRRIDAEREQWSDGVNLFCVRPGVVIAYDRNFVTNEVLRRNGIKVIEIPSSELSRGRGGTHCMTMALVREEE